MSIPKVTRIGCSMNLTDFPFDRQYCSFTIGIQPSAALLFALESFCCPLMSRTAMPCRVVVILGGRAGCNGAPSDGFLARSREQAVLK